MINALKIAQRGDVVCDQMVKSSQADKECTSPEMKTTCVMPHLPHLIEKAFAMSKLTARPSFLLPIAAAPAVD